MNKQTPITSKNVQFISLWEVYFEIKVSKSGSKSCLVSILYSHRNLVVARKKKSIVNKILAFPIKIKISSIRGNAKNLWLLRYLIYNNQHITSNFHFSSIPNQPVRTKVSRMVQLNYYLLKLLIVFFKAFICTLDNLFAHCLIGLAPSTNSILWGQPSLTHAHLHK